MKEDIRMKTITITLIALFAIISLQNTALAATSEITWTDYDKYRDIYPSNNESRKFFRERTFKNFEKYFAKLAESLPEGQVLKIEVTDVDLAGDARFSGGIHRLRIVKDIYFPRMKFSYQLVNADGNEVVSAEVELKDMNFMFAIGRTLKYRNDSLGYEKKMLDEWFKETFKDQIVKT